MAVLLILYVIQEREKMREERLKEIEILREKNRPRDDMECDDLKVSNYWLMTQFCLKTRSIIYDTLKRLVDLSIIS